MLEKGATVKGIGENDHVNVLQAAAVSGSTEMVNLLLDHGANINAQSKPCKEECEIHGDGAHFASALQAASFYLQDDVVKLLLEKKADVNIGGGPYGNALLAAGAALAADYNSSKRLEGMEKVMKIVRLLLERGATLESASGWPDLKTRHYCLENLKQFMEQLMESNWCVTPKVMPCFVCYLIVSNISTHIILPDTTSNTKIPPIS